MRHIVYLKEDCEGCQLAASRLSYDNRPLRIPSIGVDVVCDPLQGCRHILNHVQDCALHEKMHEGAPSAGQTLLRQCL